MERRRFARFRPPDSRSLSLRPPGWKAWLRRNVLVEWIDLSENGLGAVVSCEVKPGTRLTARLECLDQGEAFSVEMEVCHARPSERHPGAWEIGGRFVAPSPVLRASIRSAQIRAPKWLRYA